MGAFGGGMWHGIGGKQWMNRMRSLTGTEKTPIAGKKPTASLKPGQDNISRPSSRQSGRMPRPVGGGYTGGQDGTIGGMARRMGLRPRRRGGRRKLMSQKANRAMPAQAGWEQQAGARPVPMGGVGGTTPTKGHSRLGTLGAMASSRFARRSSY